MAVYLASDEPLNPTPWDENDPQLWIQELTAEDRSVVTQFSKPYVYYVGSHSGCGCGFQHWDLEPKDEKDKEEERSVVRSRQQLRELIERLLQKHTVVELFATWEGGQGEPPKVRREMAPDELTGTHRQFCEQGEFIRFSRQT